MKPSMKDRILSRQESFVVDELHVITAHGAFGSCTVNFINDLTTEPQTLFYDSFKDRYFYSTFSKVLAAEYHTNRVYHLFGTVYLDEFYKFLGIEMSEISGNEFTVWDMELSDGMQWIDFHHEPIIHRNIRGYSISVSGSCEPMIIEANKCFELGAEPPAYTK